MFYIMLHCRMQYNAYLCRATLKLPQCRYRHFLHCAANGFPSSFMVHRPKVTQDHGQCHCSRQNI